ncbi:hypothetical protein BC629DRAFT_1479356 [Irpex lacteus]|nr:hypothetical protein BC629DRAFT_1479356 [Irpex lacteus]
MDTFNMNLTMTDFAVATQSSAFEGGMVTGLDSETFANMEAKMADLSGRLGADTQQLSAYTTELKNREEKIASQAQALTSTQAALDAKTYELEMVSLQLEQARTYQNDFTQRLESMAATHANELRKARLEKKKRTKAAMEVRGVKEDSERKLKEALAENEELKKQLKQALLEKEEAEGDMMDIVEMDLKYEMERADRLKAEERLKFQEERLRSALMERGDMVTRINKLKAEREQRHLIESRAKLHLKKLGVSVKETAALKAQISSLVRDQDEGLNVKVQKLEAELHKSQNARKHMEAAKLAVNRADAGRKVAEKKLRIYGEVRAAQDDEHEQLGKDRAKATEYISKLRVQFADVKKERDAFEKEVKVLRSTDTTDVATVAMDEDAPMEVDLVATKLGATGLGTLSSSGSLRAALCGVENAVPSVC